MDRTNDRLLALVVTLIYLIWGLHALAHAFSLYWLYAWFDLPIHLLGGLWIGLFVLWIMRVCGVASPTKLVWGIAVSVLVFGLGWEVVEYTRKSVVEIHVGSPYAIDTLQDIIMNLAGGALACAIAELLPKQQASTNTKVPA